MSRLLSRLAVSVATSAILVVAGAGWAAACSDPSISASPESAGPGGTISWNISGLDAGASYTVTFNGSTVGSGTSSGGSVSGSFSMPDLGSSNQTVYVEAVVSHDGLNWPSSDSVTYVAPQPTGGGGGGGGGSDGGSGGGSGNIGGSKGQSGAATGQGGGGTQAGAAAGAGGSGGGGGKAEGSGPDGGGGKGKAAPKDERRAQGGGGPSQRGGDPPDEPDAGQPDLTQGAGETEAVDDPIPTSGGRFPILPVGLPVVLLAVVATAVWLRRRSMMAPEAPLPVFTPAVATLEDLPTAAPWVPPPASQEPEALETEPVATEAARVEAVDTEDTEAVDGEPVDREPVATPAVETEAMEAEPVEAKPFEAEAVEPEPLEEEAATAAVPSSNGEQAEAAEPEPQASWTPLASGLDDVAAGPQAPWDPETTMRAVMAGEEGAAEQWEAEAELQKIAVDGNGDPGEAEEDHSWNAEAELRSRVGEEPSG